MNILELAILKKMVGGGGGSGTDNYNDLSNLPQINGETLAGNKTAENLGLQDALTFDSTPTEDSTNPVESGGVYNALAGKQDNLTFDDDPTENSINPVKSGGVYSALAGKQDNLTFDGVYNASTNKAATESTVTNAIAGLDVSAFSVDADETISSLSETDGKISVTKQDIAIASNQVVAMTGYTKPSSAPATPAIQQGDTANAAIGKLEYKADVNQSNILYTLNRTGKNCMDLQNPYIVSALQGQETYTNGDNGSVTITDTNTIWSTYQVIGYVKPNTAYKLVTYVSNFSSSVSFFVKESLTSETNLAQGSIQGNGTITTDITTSSSNRIRICYNLNNSATAKSNSITLRAMLVEASTHAIDSTYVVASLPNYDLTRLESEDRAALAEEIDAGAKNLLQLAATTNTSVSGCHVTFSGTASTSATQWYGVEFTVSTSGSYVFAVKATSGTIPTTALYNVTDDANVKLYDNGTGGNDTVYLQTGKRYKAGSYLHSGTSYNQQLDVMICTKAAFGVSQKFVPYRPSYDDLVNRKPKTVYAGPSQTVVNYNIEYGTGYKIIVQSADGYAEATAYRTSGNVVLATLANTFSSNPITASSDHITISPTNWVVITIIQMF